jgi:hypothetical protein
MDLYKYFQVLESFYLLDLNQQPFGIIFDHMLSQEEVV